MNKSLLFLCRYDLGAGLAVIESARRLVPGAWARVQARRWHRDGMLKVAVDGSGGDDVSGQSGGDLRSLDIDREPSFVGGLPVSNDKNMTRIAANLGMKKIRGTVLK